MMITAKGIVKHRQIHGRHRVNATEGTLRDQSESPAKVGVPTVG